MLGMVTLSLNVLAVSSIEVNNNHLICEYGEGDKKVVLNILTSKDSNQKNRREFFCLEKGCKAEYVPKATQCLPFKDALKNNYYGCDLGGQFNHLVINLSSYNQTNPNEFEFTGSIQEKSAFKTKDIQVKCRFDK